MTPPFQSNTKFRRSRSTIITVLVVGFVALLYWLAEPKHHIQLPIRDSTVTAGIHLDNVPFVAYSGKKQAWSLWAKSVDVKHSQYSSSNTVESAVLTDIRDGKLFSNGASDPLLPIQASAGNAISKQDHVKNPDAPILRFHANSGNYYIGTSHPLPGDLSANYSARWQLILEGEIVIKTRDGDTLKTQQLTMMGLTNNLTHREEQRMQCDVGAILSRKDVVINANRLRYALDEHTVELLDGVRLTFKNGSIQSQRCFWALKENIVRIPDAAAGLLDGSAFSSDMITLNLTEETFTAAGCRFKLKRDDADGTPAFVFPQINPRENRAAATMPVIPGRSIGKQK